ncbi:MAG TPA: winged helix-turn-helix domain-containing protein, partial [Terriglobales bacterium]|nr:winged helix-turn-helix domain-containing protein [Terriglobales bacterium]
MSVTGFKFEEFELYPHRCELRRSGQPVKLENIPLNLLTLLVEKKGGLVSRQEIVERLWGADVFLDTEHGINTAIRKIRRILGDDPEEPRFVRTVMGKGYCFVAELTAIEELTSSGNGNWEKAQTPLLIPLPDAMTGISLKMLIAFGIPALLVSAALLVFWRSHHPSLPQPRIVPLTTLPGREISPSFSPDGSQVAFGWDGENDGAGFDLYVKVVGTDRAVRLTNHPAQWFATAWSPDGRYIAVHRLTQKDSGIFLIPALGGPERKLTSTIPDLFFPPSAPISWSRDGQEIAFVDHPADSLWDSYQLYVFSMATSTSTQLNTSCPRVWFPVFSPKSDTIAYLCNEDYDHSFLSLLDLHSGKNERLRYDETFAPLDFDGTAWSSDGRRIVLSSDGNIWEYTLGESQPMREVWTGHAIGLLATSMVGNRLAYEQAYLNVNIWQFNLKNINGGAHKLLASTRRQYAPHISPDGKKIVFVSDRAGSEEIWVCDISGENAIQLTSLNTLTGTPRWSPDGRQIVFDSRAEGE